MTDSEFILELSRLLSLYEGVAIENSTADGKRIAFDLRFSDVASFVRIEYFCRAANVKRTFYATGLPVDGESVSASLMRLAWTLQFESVSSQSQPECSSFFIFLIRDLKNRMLLTEHESYALIAACGGEKGRVSK